MPRDIKIRATAAVISTVCMAIAMVSAEATEGRRDRQKSTQVFSSRLSQWRVVNNDSVYFTGWFKDMCRCTKATFDLILGAVTECWDIMLLPAPNAVFRIPERVAVTIHYLTHAGSIVDSAKVFGIVKRLPTGDISTNPGIFGRSSISLLPISFSSA